MYRCLLLLLTSFLKNTSSDLEEKDLELLAKIKHVSDHRFELEQIYKADSFNAFLQRHYINTV